VKREIIISFGGHLLLLGVITVFSASRQPRDLSRPAVITVQLLGGGRPLPEEQATGTRLVEPVPRPQGKPKEKEAKKSPSRQGTEIIRKPGLGAKVEGGAALGYNYYLSQMLDRISQNWEDPYSGRTRTFQATVLFVIERDGRLTEVKLEKGSGDGAFDGACLRAVLVTEKLPPLPPEFTAPRLKIHLEFER